MRLKIHGILNGLETSLRRQETLRPSNSQSRKVREIEAGIVAGDAANRSRDWSRAAMEYEVVLRDDPSLAHIWVQYGHMMKEQGYLDKAESAYRTSLELMPDSADSHLQLGHALKLQGRLQEAKLAYRTAKDIDPSNDDAERELLHVESELAAITASIADRQPDAVSIAKTAEIEDTIGSEFDLDFYLRAHPGLSEDGIDPIRHYLNIGAAMGWDPSPDFSTKFYLARSPDIRSEGVNPLYHYIRWGRAEGRAPSALALAEGHLSYTAAAERIKDAFDPEFYLRNHPQLAANNVDPLMHYLNVGWLRGYNPSPDFSTRFYLDRSPDVVEANENPLHHYVRIGRAEGRIPKRPDGLGDSDTDLLEGPSVPRFIEESLDARFYRERYADISVHGLDPLRHYMSAGWKEGRDPAPWFSTSYYLKQYPGVIVTKINPLFHYLVWGKKNGFTTFMPEKDGVRSKIIRGTTLVRTRDLSVLAHKPAEPIEARSASPTNADCMKVDWIIPDFAAGGGGHMTIFRMIKWLEAFGHDCTIWVQWRHFDRTDTEREEILLRSYQSIKARVRTLPPNHRFDGVDALIATSWDSAYLVRNAAGAKAKFYFVQDYEPYFYPVGAQSLAARETYGFGLTCICASPWLQRLMQEHGCEAYAFRLAADEAYAPPTVRLANEVFRIAFYARDHTTRRAVELAFLALEELANRGVNFHADFFGSESQFAETAYSATNWGILKPSALSRLYGQADVGLCFSATNYSLVPQEMMAAGLPVIELDTESTREAFPEGVVMMARPDPFDIADKIMTLMNDESARRSLANRGTAWVASLSWENSAKAVEGALRSRLCGSNEPRRASAPSKRVAIKASVVIPTYNAGKLFQSVLKTVLEQRVPWPYEVIIIDSGSNDGTVEFLKDLGNRVRLHQIAKSEFQHGRTRNLGASMAKGEFVAFLTHDAKPTDEFWLYNFVVMLERFPKAAGAFGRHLAWPDAVPFTHRDNNAHFAIFDSQAICVSKYLDLNRWNNDDRAFKEFLHFYSDNNSCLRRSVWQRHPYPEVDYGEDQLWAYQVISRGYSKVYSPGSVVYHSHDYNEWQTFERAKTEATFFRKYFGYDFSPGDIKEDLSRLNTDDEIWGVRNGATQEQIDLRKRLNAHRFSGYTMGALEGLNFPSAF